MADHVTKYLAPTRLNWKVAVECVDCGTEFNVPKPDPSTEVLKLDGHPDARMIVVTVPNACPLCHNIRVVDEPNDSAVG